MTQSEDREEAGGLEEAGVNPGLQVQRAQRVVIMKLHKDDKDKNKGGYKGGI